MLPRRVGVEDARAFWTHPTQHAFGLDQRALPAAADYWVCGGVCLVFVPAMWPGVWQVHIGVIPRLAWGATTEPALAILRAFWADVKPTRLISWIDAKNRAVLALARRCGFEVDGSLPGCDVTMIGWSS